MLDDVLSGMFSKKTLVWSFFLLEVVSFPHVDWKATISTVTIRGTFNTVNNTPVTRQVSIIVERTIVEISNSD